MQLLVQLESITELLLLSLVNWLLLVVLWCCHGDKTTMGSSRPLTTALDILHYHPMNMENQQP